MEDHYMLREKLGEIISQTDQKIAGVSLRNNRFPIIFQTAFWGTLICGLFAHGMALFNKYSWHDDIFSLFLLGRKHDFFRPMDAACAGGTGKMVFRKWSF